MCDPCLICSLAHAFKKCKSEDLSYVMIRPQKVSHFSHQTIHEAMARHIDIIMSLHDLLGYHLADPRNDKALGYCTNGQNKKACLPPFTRGGSWTKYEIGILYLNFVFVVCTP